MKTPEYYDRHGGGGDPFQTTQLDYDGGDNFDAILEPQLQYKQAYETSSRDVRHGQLRPGAVPIYTSREVLSLFSQYVAIGLLYGVLPNMAYPVFTSYFHLTGAQINSATTLITMGWNFKVFVGVLSDCVPICGYRRKSWMMIGWLLCFACLVVLAVRDHGPPYYRNQQTKDDGVNKDAIAHGTFIAMVSGLASMCYIIADVAADALLVEIAQREPVATRGRLQSLAYSARTVAAVVSQSILGVGLNSPAYSGTFSWSMGLNALFWILAVPCLVMVPITFMFIRETGRDSVNVFEYVGLCWAFLQNRAVLQVMGFIFLYNFCTTMSSTAAPYVLYRWVGAANINQQFSVIAGNLLFAVGLAYTGTYGTGWNWRVVVIACLATSTAIDASVLFPTIFGAVRDQWFYLTVPLLEQVPNSIQWIIVSFINIELAEIGNEGVTYALLTTIANVAPSVSSVVSNIVGSQFHVLDDDIRTDSIEARWQVAYTYFVQYGTNVVAAIVVLCLLPAQKYHVQHLKASPRRHPFWAAFVLLVALAALVFTVLGSILSMFESTSCLILAGGHGCSEGLVVV
ncbi:Aste57867_832 [Aphanomyces stellatus]|uniref:Aste57867_832 protein n=1 Tax=Aphanomyces stellatus TaxID=120398 RepID=A0A485K8M6_9STRA|nr:hypothetical protein As57867_000831 [Aphanomyces stellatus]VFT78056.1 Aste57867_832 [Aphanomyces stellatus]